MDEIVALRLRIPVKELGCGAQAWLAHFQWTTAPCTADSRMIAAVMGDVHGFFTSALRSEMLSKTTCRTWFVAGSGTRTPFASVEFHS